MNTLVLPPDEALLEQVAAELALREPNKEAIHTLALRLYQHYSQEQAGFFDGVIDSATGMGKSFIIAGAIDYFAALGIRNFAIIAPGSAILDKTINQFSPGHRKSLLDGMETKPVLVTSDNFRSAAIAADLENQNKVKLFIFSIQSLTKPGTKQGRRTHSFQEGLGKAFYAHLDELEDLIVLADEAHCYYGPAFSKAIQELTPLALVGLTATPDRKKKDTNIFYRYPLAAAIAEGYVKTPVLVGRKDDRTDERTQLRDGEALLRAKETLLKSYCVEKDLPVVHPIMLVNCQDIAHAQDTVSFLRSEQFAASKYMSEGAVLEVHSGAKSEEALQALEEVEELNNPTRIIVQVGMLKEGWDVKNVYVIASLRASVSEVLTEQTLGRGLRLPFGKHTGHALLDQLDVVAHERYDDLLQKTGKLVEEFIDFRTTVLAPTTNGEAAGDGLGTDETSIRNSDPSLNGNQETHKEAELTVEEGTNAEDKMGVISVADTDERIKEATEQANTKPVPLMMRADAPVIEVPYITTQVIAQEFSLQLVTKEADFRELGRQLAVNPERYLRRTTMDAEVTSDAEGVRHAQMRTGEAKERVEAVQVVEKPEEGRQRVINETMQSRVVPSREGERAQAARLLNAVLEGAGGKSGLLLTHYPDRLVQGMVREISNAQRRLPRSAQTSTLSGYQSFSPNRMRRAKTSRDRRGKFVKGVAYEGWNKGLFEQAWFDSKPEREMANLLDDEDSIVVWDRLLINDLPILWNGAEQNYNPDLLAIDRDDTRWVIEIKSDREASNEEVQAKRQAALAWANAVSQPDKAQWRYLLVTESDLAAAKGSWQALVRATSA